MKYHRHHLLQASGQIDHRFGQQGLFLVTLLFGLFDRRQRLA